MSEHLAWTRIYTLPEHLRRSFVEHWPSTVGGICFAVWEILHQCSIPELLALPWPQLRQRLIYAALIASIGAFGRFGRHPDEKPLG